MKKQNNLFLVALEKALKTTNAEELATLIKENNLTWEMVPTEMLNNKIILEALIDKMPINALLRNLNRFSVAGMFESNVSARTKNVTARILEESPGKIHPVTMLNYLKTYESGRGVKGSLTWDANARVVENMSKAFGKCFDNVEVSQKNILLGVDNSGSMSASVSNMNLSANEVASILSLVYYKNNPNCDIVTFNTSLHTASFNKNSSYEDALKNSTCGGGTDCALPLLHAYKMMQKGTKYDACVILTDSETWAGSTHAQQALDAIRKINPNFRVVLVGLTATHCTIVDNDFRNLNICGFDSSVLEVTQNFIEGF